MMDHLLTPATPDIAATAVAPDAVLSLAAGGFFSGDALIFSIPALVGTALFLIKLGLSAFAGIDADADVDGLGADVDLDGLDADAGVDVPADADLDLGADAHDALHHGDSTSAFTFFSVQGIMALVMGFGWGGLVGREALGFELPGGILMGVLAGAFFMWLAAWLMSLIMRLQGSGNISSRDAIGCEGVVYVGVPAAGAGRGQVRVIVHEHARLYNAVTEGEALPTKARVKVTKVNRDNSLTVTRI
jgi:hypothetical protein